MVNKKRSLRVVYNNKRGQVTIFIIIAILVVVGGVLVYMFAPELGISDEKEDLEDPQEYIQGCVSEELERVTMEASLQGGSLEPEHYYQYQGENLTYLGYSNEYWKFGVVQRPFLRTHMEKEIKKGISRQVESCFSSLKEDYENKGHSVDIEDKEINVKILPEKIQANLNKTVNIQKEENTETHKNFNVNFKSELYNMLTVAKSIVEMESGWGTAEPSLYMNIYHDLWVSKKEQDDETTVYIIENVNTGNKFQFASRSLASPIGYGVSSQDLLEE